ncbi:hypothetical protein [Bradyrhizobium sp. STM 3562]|uniref:hypothetical protein n=1 Tax=Bradyrhizobium sp. STM 3562 TaxID=578924 RepID=UPI00388EF91A
MNWSWATSLDDFWRSSAFPMWLTLAAAGFFGVLVVITLARAEKSVATGALTVITLLAVGIAVASTIRGYGTPSGRSAATEARSVAPISGPVLPSLSCLDDLAGDVVLAACERAVFASAESTAAAVSYIASQISRLTALGDAATAAKIMTPDMQAVRRSIEHDRYGLVAQVLQAREHCSPTECSVFRSLTDNHQIITNMDEHLYEALVNRYAATWSAPQTTAATGSSAMAPGMGALAAFPPSVPTGKPTNADFPSAASTPPVSIMAPEPGTGTGGARSSPPPGNAAAPAPRPSPAVAAAKKTTPKPPRSTPSPTPAPGVGPTLLSPTPSQPAPSND